MDFGRGTFLQQMQQAWSDGILSSMAMDKQPMDTSRPPKNLLLVSDNPREWKHFQEVCKKDNLVICIEFTNNTNPNCVKIQKYYVEMAKEFMDNYFLRVIIAPHSAFEELRKDVGGVNFTPTILILFFAPDGVERVKIEGFNEIVQGYSSGIIKKRIKEYVSARRKILRSKLLAEESTRQEQQKYPQKKEEPQTKEEVKSVSQSREQFIQKLMVTDLNKCSIGELKTHMRNLKISTAGCFEKKDLKDKLIENVPELKRRYKSSSFSNVDSISTKTNNEKSRASTLSAPPQSHQEENRIAKPQEATTARNYFVERPSSEGVQDEDRKVLEKEYLEMRILYTTSFVDFNVLGLIHSGADGRGSTILRVTCSKPGIPDRQKTYAMKVISNFFKSRTQTQVKGRYKNEYQILSQLPRHDNILQVWAFFYDQVDLSKIGMSKDTGVSLFILMEEYSTNMSDLISNLVTITGPTPLNVLKYMRDLLHGLFFLQQHRVVHRNLQLSNLVMSKSGHLVIIDFDKAIQTDDNFRIPYRPGDIKGGNDAHLAPEIIMEKSGANTILDYSKQPVWAAGILAYEFAGHQNPYTPAIQQNYSKEIFSQLQETYCVDDEDCHPLPKVFGELVSDMLDQNPSKRPTLQECLDIINVCIDQI